MALRKNPWIIAITAGETDADRRQCLAAGMDDCLSEPINVELLRTALEQLGGRSQPQTILTQSRGYILFCKKVAFRCGRAKT